MARGGQFTWRLTEVTPATDALLRQARQALAGERGHFIEDDEFIAAMATAILESGATSGAQAGAKFQIRVTVCQNCEQAFQEGAGRKIAISQADAARAECDAQRIGDDRRARQDIPPKTRRFIWHRDGGKCAVPTCRSSRFIEVHHIVARTDDGNHEAGNLTLLCDGHHRALHADKLVITGIAPDLTCRFVNDPPPHPEIPHAEIPHTEFPRTEVPHAVTASLIPHVEKPSKFAITAMIVQARQVLRTSGFQASEANRFVEAALADDDRPRTLEALIVAALKHSR